MELLNEILIILAVGIAIFIVVRMSRSKYNASVEAGEEPTGGVSTGDVILAFLQMSVVIAVVYYIALNL